MKEQNKYYTPSEEELFEEIIHGGDVYHKKVSEKSLRTKIVFYHLNDPTRKIKWFLEINNKNSDGLNWIDPSNYELKHLDREDIESLGFEHSHNYDGEEYPSLFDEHGYSAGFLLDTQLENDIGIFLYLFPDGYVVIDFIFKCGSIPHSFAGTIKNKSELKKVLKMIGV
jgi:hypothetical protein